MKNVSIPVPSLNNYAPSASPPFDIRTIDPTALLTKLSMDLLPTDQLTIYGTLDVTAGPFSPNSTLLGTVRGNNGQPVNGGFLSYWPYLFIQRTAGQTPTGASSLFFVSSSSAIGTPTAPVSTALPRLNTSPGSTVLETALTLPQAIVAVASTNGFTPTGSFFIPALDAVVTYTGITPTSFTGCSTSSTATMVLGQAVNQIVTSSLLNLAPFGNPVRVGLSGNQTTLDTFSLYGTDDPSVVSTSGGTLLANLQGAGGLSSFTLVSAYQYVYVIRTGGFTVGNLLAWGANDAGSGGAGSTAPINLASLAVGNTAVSGNFGTPPLTAPQSVDIYSSFVLTQTTGGDIIMTLPTPTNPAAGKIVFLSSASASTNNFLLYGNVISPGTGIVLQWDGSEWTTLGL
jgi:hypothetical protein